MADVAELKASIEWDVSKLKGSASAANAEIKKFADDTDSHANRAKKSVDDVGSSFGGLGSEIAKGLGVGIGFGSIHEGIEFVKEGIGDLIAEASNSQMIMQQTEAVIKSTGGAAGITAKDVGDLATNLSKVTPFDDEVIQQSENLLLTFTSIGKDVMPQATETVLNMSQALGQDTKSSAIQLGKALQDPINGVTALRRVGVNFTDAQKEQIKTLVESGHTLDAQKIILKELNTEFGNSAKAAGETYAGKLKILETQIGNVKEAIGGALISAIVAVTGKFTPLMTDIIEKLPELIATVTDKIGDFASAIGKMIPQEVGDAARGLADALGGKLRDAIGFISDHKEIFAAVGIAIAAIAAPSIVAGIIALGVALTGVIASATVAAAPWLLIGAAIAAVTLGVIELVKHWDEIQQKVPGIKGLSDIVVSEFKLWVNAFKDAAFYANALFAAFQGKESFGAILGPIGDVIDKLVAKFKDIAFYVNAVFAALQGKEQFGAIFGSWADKLDGARDALGQVVEGVKSLLSGDITSGLEHFIEAFASAFGDKAATAFRGFIDGLGTLKDAFGTFFTKDLPEFFTTTVPNAFKALPDLILAALKAVAEAMGEQAALYFIVIPETIFKTIKDGLSDAWDWLQSDDGPKGWPARIVAFFDTLKDDIGTKLTEFKDGITTGFGDAWDWITGDEGPKSWPDKIVAFFDSLKDDIVTKLGEFKDGITDAMGKAWDWITGDDGPKSWPGKIVDFFDDLKNDIITKLGEFKDGITQAMGDAWTWLSDPNGDGPASWPGKVIHFFDSLGTDITTKLGEFKDGVTGAMGDVWNWLSNPSGDGPASWPGKIMDFFTDLPGKFGELGTSILTGLGNALGDFGHTIGQPFEAGIDVINAFISGVNSTLSKFNAGSVPTIPHLPGFAAGGTVNGSQFAMVGEAGPEVVMLPGGSQVIPNHMLGFQGGTSGAAAAVGSFITAATDFLKDIWGKLPSMNLAGIAGVQGDMVRGVGKEIADAAKAFLQHLFDEAKSHLSLGGALPSGQITDILKQALAATQSPAGWLSALQWIQMHEDPSGNPAEQNPVAVPGLGHATGIMQVTPGTFAAVGGPHFGAITDPLANAIASILWIKQKYGSPDRIPGLGKEPWAGYANGGWITEPVSGVGRSGQRYSFGERGPEYVTPNGQSGAGGTVQNINIEQLTLDGVDIHDVPALIDMIKRLPQAARAMGRR
jgi:SLT domain-containing protein